jgi:DNA mismatch endonuclease (patch repair protein)
MRTDKNKKMQAVRCRDSKIELALRKALWQKGYRYRKNFSILDGTPDIVFVSLKIAVFCDSEFWHGYDWQNRKNDIKSNKNFWIEKIERNMERDAEVDIRLREKGWTPLRFWGKEIATNVDKCVNIIEKVMRDKNSAPNSQRR